LTADSRSPILCLEAQNPDDPSYPHPLRKRLYDLFDFRAYPSVAALSRSLGKLSSDIDLRRLALFNLLRPQHNSDLEAMEVIASWPGERISVDAVRKSIERARADDADDADDARTVRPPTRSSRRV